MKISPALLNVLPRAIATVHPFVAIVIRIYSIPGVVAINSRLMTCWLPKGKRIFLRIRSKRALSVLESLCEQFCVRKVQK